MFFNMLDDPKINIIILEAFNVTKIGMHEPHPYFGGIHIEIAMFGCLVTL
jgi:hypothetical protein